MAQDNIMERIESLLSIPPAVGDVAYKKWESFRKAVESATSNSKTPVTAAIALQDQYLAARFFCDDMRDLIDYHSLTLDEILRIEYSERDVPDHQIFVPDAHLFQAFSDRSSSPRDIHNNHAGFSFIADENLDASAATNDDRYRLFVYDSIFKDENVSLIEASRKELATTLGYLHDVALQESATKVSRQDGVVELLGGLFSAWFSAKVTRREFNPVEAFNKLMAVAGAPLAKQRLVFARFITAIKHGNFLPAEAAVLRALGIEGQALRQETLDFSRILRLTRNNPAVIAASRNQIHKFYEDFREVTSYLGIREQTDQDHNLLRGGELLDLLAIHEIHVLNTCLEFCGLPCRFRYCTTSNRIFDFVRMFDRKNLRVPLVHPRNAFLYRNKKMFSKHVHDFRHIVSHAVAGGRSMDIKGERLSVAIRDFSKKHRSIVELVKYDFTHAVADEESERRLLLKVISTTLELLETPSKEQEQQRSSIINELDKKLGSQVERVKSDIKRRSSDLEVQAREVYESYLRPKTSQASVITRTHLPSETNHSRIVCLPTSGSYRRMFVVHQTPSMAKASTLKDPSESLMSFDDLIASVKESHVDSLPGSQSNSLHDRIVRSITMYLQALIAASNRDWTLVNSIIEQAHEALRDKNDKRENNDTKWKYFGFEKSELVGAGSWLKAKAMLHDQEILFLSNFCKRALSESSGSQQRRVSWLRRSRLDLSKSAELTLDIPRALAKFQTRLNPVSCRQTLAAIGLATEWLVQIQENKLHSLSTTRQLTLEAVLPSCLKCEDAESIAWQGLDVISLPIQSESDAIDFYIAAVELVNRLQKCYEDVCRHQNSHSAYFWRYKLLRAYSLKYLLVACVECDLVNFDKTRLASTVVDPNDLQKLQGLLEEERTFLSAKKVYDRVPEKDETLELTQSEPSQADNAPFLMSMVTFAKLHHNAGNSWQELTTLVVRDRDKFVRDYLALKADCHRLDPFGFPRRIVRAVKDRYEKIAKECIGGRRH